MPVTSRPNVSVKTTPNDPWRAYAEQVLAPACQGGTCPLANELWRRLCDEAGPSIHYLGNEDPDMVIRWAYLEANADDRTRYREAACRLFHDKLFHGPTITFEDAATLSVLAGLIENWRPRAGQDAVENKFARELAQRIWENSVPTDLAKTLHDLKLPSGSRFLSYVLRLISLFDRSDRARAWWQLLTAESFAGASMSAFLGFARCGGANARVALPYVARAQVQSGRSWELANLLLGFHHRRYLDPQLDEMTERPTNRRSLDAGDFRTLFCLVPEEKLVDFRSAVFSALEQIEPQSSSMIADWQAAALQEDKLVFVILAPVDSAVFRDQFAVHPSLAETLSKTRPILFQRLERRPPYPFRLATRSYLRLGTYQMDRIDSLWYSQSFDIDDVASPTVSATTLQLFDHPPNDDADVSTLEPPKFDVRPSSLRLFRRRKLSEPVAAYDN